MFDFHKLSRLPFPLVQRMVFVFCCMVCLHRMFAHSPTTLFESSDTRVGGKIEWGHFLFCRVRNSQFRMANLEYSLGLGNWDFHGPKWHKAHEFPIGKSGGGHTAVTSTGQCKSHESPSETLHFGIIRFTEAGLHDASFWHADFVQSHLFLRLLLGKWGYRRFRQLESRLLRKICRQILRSQKFQKVPKNV